MNAKPEEYWLDVEFMDRCATEVQEHVRLATVRHILAQILESLADG
jgi:hypothetical protein